ncbi:MAG TPA: hypothetical protein VGV37_08090 [Aliidongia sp.]|uniref:hypothetical protein n=1 Tax=Aliidongia sp. TaxID=1914230 RepID=UPI002DDCCDD3|nr:hypothetical protein [Aliidongia sp.]HEV2674486.1 hypothetical protein [Aliidongia sp.]
MEIALLVSAGLTVLLGIVHSGLGEARIIGPLLAPESRTGLLAKSAFARGILRFAWHLTSIAWWGMAAILAACALAVPALPAALTAISATLAVSGLIVLAMSRGRHLAWPVFLAAAGLAALPILA